MTTRILSGLFSQPPDGVHLLPDAGMDPGEKSSGTVPLTAGIHYHNGEESSIGGICYIEFFRSRLVGQVCAAVRRVGAVRYLAEVPVIAVDYLFDRFLYRHGRRIRHKFIISGAVFLCLVVENPL